MRPALTAAPAPALASPAVAAPVNETGTPSSDAVGAQGCEAVSPEMVAEAHQLGLPGIPWTVNTTADMAQLMDLGVDGIITAYATRLRTLMEERGLKLPHAYEATQ